MRVTLVILLISAPLLLSAAPSPRSRSFTPYVAPSTTTAPLDNATPSKIQNIPQKQSKSRKIVEIATVNQQKSTPLAIILTSLHGNKKNKKVYADSDEIFDKNMLKLLKKTLNHAKTQQGMYKKDNAKRRNKNTTKYKIISTVASNNRAPLDSDEMNSDISLNEPKDNLIVINESSNEYRGGDKAVINEDFVKDLTDELTKDLSEGVIADSMETEQDPNTDYGDDVKRIRNKYTDTDEITEEQDEDMIDDTESDENLIVKFQNRNEGNGMTSDDFKKILNNAIVGNISTPASQEPYSVDKKWTDFSSASSSKAEDGDGLGSQSVSKSNENDVLREERQSEEDIETSSPDEQASADVTNEHIGQNTSESIDEQIKNITLQANASSPSGKSNIWGPNTMFTDGEEYVWPELTGNKRGVLQPMVNTWSTAHANSQLIPNSVYLKKGSLNPNEINIHSDTTSTSDSEDDDRKSDERQNASSPEISEEVASEDTMKAAKGNKDSKKNKKLHGNETKKQKQKHHGHGHSDENSEDISDENEGNDHKKSNKKNISFIIPTKNDKKNQNDDNDDSDSDASSGDASDDNNSKQDDIKPHNNQNKNNKKHKNYKEDDSQDASDENDSNSEEQPEDDTKHKQKRKNNKHKPKSDEDSNENINDLSDSDESKSEETPKKDDTKHKHKRKNNKHKPISDEDSNENSNALSESDESKSEETPKKHKKSHKHKHQPADDSHEGNDDESNENNDPEGHKSKHKDKKHNNNHGKPRRRHCEEENASSDRDLCKHRKSSDGDKLPCSVYHLLFTFKS